MEMHPIQVANMGQPAGGTVITRRWCKRNEYQEWARQKYDSPIHESARAWTEMKADPEIKKKIIGHELYMLIDVFTTNFHGAAPAILNE